MMEENMANTRIQLRTLADQWDRHCGQKIPHPNRVSAERESIRLERVERANLTRTTVSAAALGMLATSDMRGCGCEHLIR